MSKELAPCPPNLRRRIESARDVDLSGTYIAMENSIPSEDCKENKDAGFVHWSSSDGISFFPAGPKADSLTPGVYEIKINSHVGLYFEKIPISTEGILRFPDTTSDRIISEIQKFWEREEYFREYGLTYKRGMLFHGPPGTGKTCAIKVIMNDVVKRGGIVIRFTNPYDFMGGMRILRQIQPTTPVVVTMEDIDSTLDIHSESEVLNILDGVNAVDRVVFLATTNYPDRLGARIVNRPSRFDKVFRIGFPSAASRRMYFEHLIGQGDSERLAEKVSDLKIDLDQWVKDTDEMSLAHLKELFIQVVIIGDPYEESIELLKKMTDYVDGNSAQNQLGFAPARPMDYYD